MTPSSIHGVVRGLHQSETVTKAQHTLLREAGDGVATFLLLIHVDIVRGLSVGSLSSASSLDNIWAEGRARASRFGEYYDTYGLLDLPTYGSTPT